MTDVETVARAMCASGGFDPDEIMPNDGPRWRYYALLAAAALSAATPGIEARVRGEIADYLDGSNGKIPMLSVFAPLVSGNNMPDMSGDARSRLLPHVRKRFDDAMQAVAAAIRKG